MMKINCLSGIVSILRVFVAKSDENKHCLSDIFSVHRVMINGMKNGVVK